MLPSVCLIDVEAHLAIGGDELLEVGRHELGEDLRAKERRSVEAVVRAQGEAVQSAVGAVAPGAGDLVVHHFLRLGLQRVRFIGKAPDECLHLRAAGD